MKTKKCSLYSCQNERISNTVRFCETHTQMHKAKLLKEQQQRNQPPPDTSTNRVQEAKTRNIRKRKLAVRTELSDAPEVQYKSVVHTCRVYNCRKAYVTLVRDVDDGGLAADVAERQRYPLCDEHFARANRDRQQRVNEEHPHQDSEPGGNKLIEYTITEMPAQIAESDSSGSRSSSNDFEDQRSRPEFQIADTVTIKLEPGVTENAEEVAIEQRSRQALLQTILDIKNEPLDEEQSANDSPLDAADSQATDERSREALHETSIDIKEEPLDELDGGDLDKQQVAEHLSSEKLPDDTIPVTNLLLQHMHENSDHYFGIPSGRWRRLWATLQQATALSERDICVCLRWLRLRESFLVLSFTFQLGTVEAVAAIIRGGIFSLADVLRCSLPLPTPSEERPECILAVCEMPYARPRAFSVLLALHSTEDRVLCVSRAHFGALTSELLNDHLKRLSIDAGEVTVSLTRELSAQQSLPQSRPIDDEQQLRSEMIVRTMREFGGFAVNVSRLTEAPDYEDGGLQVACGLHNLARAQSEQSFEMQLQQIIARNSS